MEIGRECYGYTAALRSVMGSIWPLCFVTKEYLKFHPLVTCLITFQQSNIFIVRKILQNPRYVCFGTPKHAVFGDL